MSQLENNQKVKHLSAVILCAGSGSRIKSISKSLPKPLIGIKSLNYKPILLTTIESLIKLGVTRIGIIIGFHAQKIKNYIENLKETIAFSHINFSLIDATKSFEFGPLYSFLSITTSDFFLGGKNYLILPGDTYFEFELLKNSIKQYISLIPKVGNKPILFYTSLSFKQLKEKFNALVKEKQMISIIDSDSKSHEFEVLNEIRQKKESQIKEKKLIKYTLPLLLFPFSFIKRIQKEESEAKVNNIREILNYFSKLGEEVICLQISKGKFFDIDYKDNLNTLNKELKKRGH